MGEHIQIVPAQMVLFASRLCSSEPPDPRISGRRWLLEENFEGFDEGLRVAAKCSIEAYRVG